ncbi:MAG: transporter substrate-binding domain-containing protein [Desulfovibrionaceae bacterium]|nr:transporter substrate-binding domain-containing protein [Desulfovibrionaceae bacterium]
MRTILRILCVTLAVLLLPFVFSGCEKSAAKRQRETVTYASFREIPGVTDGEIRAIEALQKQGRVFVYGAIPGAEAFIDENGETGGYAALVCGWLTELFGVSFIPTLYGWGDLLAGLERYEIDFTGELAPAEQRPDTSYMTGAITERLVKYVRLADGVPLADIASLRLPRLAFLSGADTAEAVAARASYRFETIFIDNFDAAYAMLKNGRADAIFAKGGTEAAVFDEYSDVAAEDFFPLIYSPVALSTQNPELAPLISVAQKALQSGAARHLTGLYERGQQDYLRHKLYTQLSAEEKAHIHNRPVARFAAEHYNYPISFYNTYEKQWRGVAFDVLGEVEKLTGLSFERVNDQYTEWPDLLGILESGEASMLTELLYSEDRAARFIWPRTMFLSDNYALLSKSDFRNISMSEVRNVKVGLTQATVYSELFRSWFPNHENIVEYESSDEAFNALDRGDIDMVMSSQRRLLALTNYHEFSGYKANIVFEFASHSTFGFNKDEAVLCSIVDKALRMIDVKGIAAHWVHNTYDYQGRLAREERPWLIGVSILLGSVLVLLFVLFQRKRREERDLEALVHKRTQELEKRTAELDSQHSIMGIINYAAVLLLESGAEDYLGALNRSMEMLCNCLEADRVYLWQNIRKDDGRLYYRQVCKWTHTDWKMDDSLFEFSYQETLPSWEELLSKGEILNGPLDTLPEATQGFFSPYQLQSLLVVPLFLRGEFWGFVSFDDCHRRRVFSDSEENALRSWGLLAVGSVQRGEIARRMRQTLTKMEAVIGNYKGVIWSVDDKGVITTFNGQYLKSIGVEPSFLEGKKLEIARLKNRHLDIIDNVEKTFRDGPQDWIGEIDGGVFHSYTVPMRDGDGETIGVVGSTDDVTETVKLQRDLETAVEAAKVASRAKSVFLANMSHEIRTPMNAIMGITEIQLQNENLESGIKEALGRIHSSSDLLLGIINDILDMSKIEAGKLELVPEEYELMSLINDTAQLNMMRIGSKQIEFDLRVDENTPAVVVGDALRVKQILNNVLSNAFKYTAKGLVTMSVSHESGNVEGLAPDEVIMVFRVRDTGQGMTAEQVSKLFDEYTRFNQEANRATEGTGLGMNITRSLVLMMRGEIFVESELGLGSIFTVRLPQKKSGSGVLGPELVENMRQFRLNSSTHMKRAQIVREPMPYGSVLVVDDVETNIYVAQGLMTPYGLAFDSATGGAAAIEKIRQGRTYDIVFMDHMMPGMDGFEATRRLRDLGYTLPIVALTANAVAGQAEIFLEKGFDDFIPKPIDIRHMNVLLNKYIRDRQPPEVIEAARRGQNLFVEKGDDVPEPSRGPAMDPKLAKIFIRDASKSIEVLKALCEKQGAYDDEDVRMYVINVHGLKSALANIGEAGLAAAALKLEKAGRKGDAARISAQTPALLNELQELIVRITPKEEAGGGSGDEDPAYLREKLLALKAACAAYNKKAAREALAEIERKTWPRPTRELLDTISEYLLHSQFKGIIGVVDEALMML